jgi:aspartyl-tRNA(Asn)/glutamyl-tRNA(Gln) amidotransferase subunit C
MPTVVASLMPDDLTAGDVERIAALAHLALTDEETSLYARQLTRILEYARQIAELDLAGVPPTCSTSAGLSPERPDLPRPSIGREAALSNAPDSASGLFRVPRVLGEG